MENKIEAYITKPVSITAMLDVIHAARSRFAARQEAEIKFAGDDTRKLREANSRMQAQYEVFDYLNEELIKLINS